MYQSSSFITKVRYFELLSPFTSIRSSRSHIFIITIATEEYHSTPETQTDEAYNHPEDIEHFASHEKIEVQEAVREAKFQGISVEEALAQHEPPPEDPNAPVPESSTSNDSSNVVAEGGDVAQEPVAAPGKKVQVQRQPSPDSVDPAIRFREAKAESEKHGEWGSGDSGYQFPGSPSEKMRYVQSSQRQKSDCRTVC